MKNELLKKIQSSKDLPEPYKGIANLIGIENTLILADKLGGQVIYFPCMITLYRQIRDCQMKEEFNGYNIYYLARKHHISIRRAQQIVRGIKPKKANVSAQ